MHIIQEEEIRWAVKILEKFVFSTSRIDIPQHTKDKALFIFREWKKQSRTNYKSVFSTYVPKHIRVQKYSNCI